VIKSPQRLRLKFAHSPDDTTCKRRSRLREAVVDRYKSIKPSVEHSADRDIPMIEIVASFSPRSETPGPYKNNALGNKNQTSIPDHFTLNKKTVSGLMHQNSQLSWVSIR